IFFFQAEDGIRDRNVTGVQTCALPIYDSTKEPRSSDVFSSMYTEVDVLESVGNRTDYTKPHIVCEYGHAMGNGPGALKEYWETRSEERRVGKECREGGGGARGRDDG